MPKFDVCALGCVCWDYVGIVECYPELDEKALLTDLIQMGGGLSATAMSAVAALGGKAAIFGRIGDHDSGAQIRPQVEREGGTPEGMGMPPGQTLPPPTSSLPGATGGSSGLGGLLGSGL